MSASPIVRIGVAQYPLDAFADLAAWFDKLALWVDDAARSGAQLLVFPEYGAMEAASPDGVGRDLSASLRAVSHAMPTLDEHLSALAQAHGVTILGPSGPVAVAGGYRNRAVLYAPSGKRDWQDKLIMTPFERSWGISGGSLLSVFDTPVGRLGIAICYDSEFPLIGSVLAQAGAEIILVPSCTEHVSGYQRVQIGARARALEQQIVTAVSHTVGPAPWSAAVDANTGAAGVYVPPDIALAPVGVLAIGERDKPGWVMADVDLAALSDLRTTGEMRNRIDWASQPGVATPGDVRVVDLR
jgi:predicted amidohydrolase